MEQTPDAATSDNVTTQVNGLASLVDAPTTQTTTDETPTQTVNPFNTFNEILSEDGKFIDKWTERLPEPLKVYEKTLGKFKNPVDLLNSYANLEKSFSSRSNSIKIPGDDAKDEDWSAYRDAIGAPKDAKEYGLTRPETIAEDQWNSSLAEKASTIASKYGIPKKALHELVETYNGSVKDLTTLAETRLQKQVDETVQTLSQEWGAESKTQWQKAARAAEFLGLPLDDNAIMRPDIIKALLKIDELTGDDKGLIGQGNSAKDTYQEQLDKLRASDEFTGKKGHSAALAATKKAAELMGKIHNVR